MSALPAGEVPTTRDEIDRKAFEHLEALALDLENGRISEAQFDTGVRAVWACVSGLASSWVIDTISEIKDQKGDRSFRDIRTFIKAEKVIILVRKYGGEKLLVVHNDAPLKMFDFSKKTTPQADALKAQNYSADRITAQGFKAI